MTAEQQDLAVGSGAGRLLESQSNMLRAIKNAAAIGMATVCVISTAAFAQTSQALPVCPGIPGRVPPHCLRVKPGLGFMLNSQIYLAGLRAIDPELVEYFFNNPGSCLFTNNYRTNPVPDGWTARGGLKTTSYSSFKTTFQGNMDPHVSMVIYDNEKWANNGQTPHDEQIAPAEYTRLFAQLAHEIGLRFIATPSRDLASDQTDYNGGTLDSYYLATDKYSSPGVNRPFPAWAAAVSDVFEIQAQVHTTDGSYFSFTRQAVEKAVAANKGIEIIIGLSTNYGDAQDMYNAVMSTYRLPNVNGYWINLSTTKEDYQEVVNFLRMLRAEGF
jgi:hypothetical protein